MRIEVKAPWGGGGGGGGGVDFVLFILNVHGVRFIPRHRFSQWL